MQHEMLNHLNKPFLRWEYDQENNWLYLNWIGFVSTENIMKGVKKVLEELVEHRCAYILNDNRSLCGPWDGGSDFIQNHWVPKAREAGLRYFAHILAPNVAGALAAQDLHRSTADSFQMQLFGDAEKARQWLKAMQAQDCMA